MLAELKAKNMRSESPILVRIFKEESELEVWKQDDSGRFALLRNYPICRWSGELGPKIKPATVKRRRASIPSPLAS